ncbi:AraC family transcriptional regulator ligand-binding domain-containing protein [Nocardia sp. 2]|uniref:AraC family transcriptional regulator ligand-binding domain-containing protein n=1 Tax=Nocardia acididurans TaxID=2802282 RepID=A0ABS1MG78_9NOCA|nr:AraC family transcriptional regulator [Nocardia acididurans]MBL1079622.1 AraC family transcriptional regulator ligand-binding domain-containing protein [Nocardia acididurans]
MEDNWFPLPRAEACVALAARKGWDLSDIPGAIGTPSSEASGVRLTALLIRRLWQLTGDEMFGLGSHPVPRGAFQVLCLAVSSAPDLGTTLERFADAATVFPGLPRFSLHVGRQETRWAADVRLIDDAEHLVADASVVFTHRLLGWLTGCPLPVRRVELCYPKPHDVTALERNLPAPIAFDCESAALIIDSGLLGTPIVQSEHELGTFLSTAPSGFLAPPEHLASLREQVRCLLDAERGGQWKTVEAIARHLNMSSATLRRKLRAEHTTVSELRDEVLRTAAMNGLSQGRETIAELAARLGFSEPSAFTRAFRRWTGLTPHNYRTAFRQTTEKATVA